MKPPTEVNMKSLLEGEEHFRFLNDLAKATRTLADPEQIMAVMSRMLGEHLRASRCAYADVESNGEQFTILDDYTDGCASTAGTYHLSLFGARAVTTLNSGQTLIVCNVDTELQPGDGADMFNAIGIKAIMTCPLVKNGALRAMMAVHQSTPREWTPGEIAIVQEVVERCWATIERRTAEEKLRQSEALLRIAGRTARLGGWAVDLPEVRITWSEEVCTIHEVPPGTVLGLEQALSFYTPPSRDAVGQAFDACARQGAPFDLELELITSKGTRIWVRTIGEAQRNAAGAIARVQGAIQDVTERKRAEIRINRLNRVYAVLSQINGLIVRVPDPDELYREACRIAVEAGAFRMAWIGVIDPQTLDGEVVAWHGVEQGFIDRIRLTAREGTPHSDRPACRALQLSLPVICNDIATNDSLAPLRDELLGGGHKSAGYFPLMPAGRPVAVIALFAGELDVFDDEETRLLLELAGNISFALDHLEKKKKLSYLAYYDELTGLANRSLFLERLAQYMRSAVRGGHKLGLLLIDLERFKNINDSLGRPAGDALLKQVAQWMTRNLGDANLSARVGPDQFALVLPEVGPEGNLARFLEKTMEAFLEHPFRLNEAVFRIAAKVGVALFPDNGDDVDTLFKHAEAALKKAKASGDRYLFYTQTMTASVAAKLTLENQLRQALDREEFVLHYQPKVSLASGRLTSAEALIRWNDPRTGLVPPGRFIPILEETGLIYEVGRWALRKAIQDYLRWRAAGLAAVRIAVNVSPLQLRHRGFVAEIEQAIGIDAHAAAGLEIEITESLIMEDIKHSIASLQAIRAMGVSIAIDDFGTGFSSLSYLAKLPVDTLKIDRSFVIEMTTGPQGLALVSVVVKRIVARCLKLKRLVECLAAFGFRVSLG